MNESRNYNNDHGAELQKILDEVENAGQVETEEKKPVIEPKTGTKRDVDILNLPPRKEVHGNHNKRTKLKISGASLRLIFVILILILGVSFYLWGGELIDVINRM
ncbi:hypothetical protein GCM10007063_31330 [Lentibacillus kapialis]|uniref:Uncharacterized protein n=1 Tax=Lentibacillus kapialis TaxID=340214 RepID=A0A917V0Z6_9BACI|nr:hypothetical protein [Lentibacillus kapialis]GGK06502.1 hypothetical protein GCM10007063_31330 [Lentibacillus kapialis]